MSNFTVDMGRTPLSEINSNRRQSQGTAGRKSFVGGSNRLSLAPPARVTSTAAPGARLRDTRTSFAPQAAQQISRRSSAYNKTFTGTKSAIDKEAYEQKIKSKPWQNAAANKILSVITAKGYNQGAISAKAIASGVSSKEYFNMIITMYRVMDPGYSIPEGVKLDEEIPALFKILGYPFQISKSALMNAGAPHAWPWLLHSLSWLADAINYDDVNQSSQDQQLGLETDLPDNCLFMYIEDGYKRFLSGNDDYSEIDQKLKSTIDAKTIAVTTDIQEMKVHIDSLQREIVRLRSDASRLPALQKQKADFLADIPKFQQRKAALESHHLAVQKKLDEIKRELNSRETEKAQLQEERSHLQEVIRVQELKEIDVEKMTKDRHMLEDGLRATAQQKDICEKAISELEATQMKRHEEIEFIIKHSNSISSRLRLVPSAAKYANGKNFELIFIASAPNGIDTLSTQIKGDVVPGVTVFKNSLSQRLVRAQEEYLQQKDILDRKDDLLTEKQDELNALMSKLSKCEQSYKAEKISGNERIQQVNAEAAAIITEINRCRQQMSNILIESSARAEKSQKEAELLIRTLQAKREDLQNNILSSLDFLTNHKVYIQDTLQIIQAQHHAVQLSLSKEK